MRGFSLDSVHFVNDVTEDGYSSMDIEEAIRQSLE